MSEERKAEIAANWKRAEDSIAAAKLLAEAGFHDFVASRAYYAAFHAAAAALLSEGISFRTHAGVLNGIHHHFVKPGRLSRDLGRGLSWMAELRAIGDYGETRHVPEPEAREAVETAERVIAALKQLVK